MTQLTELRSFFQNESNPLSDWCGWYRDDRDIVASVNVFEQLANYAAGFQILAAYVSCFEGVQISKQKSDGVVR